MLIIIAMEVKSMEFSQAQVSSTTYIKYTVLYGLIQMKFHHGEIT